MSPMRLWSLHPSLLDRAGIVALWREGLLAQKVLRGKTRGYRYHPQLVRFQQCRHPVAAIGAYLRGVAAEGRTRGYRFDLTKIVSRKRTIAMQVSRGQLRYELLHLKRKLRVRDPKRHAQLRTRAATAHPLFRIVPGKIAAWERRGKIR